MIRRIATFYLNDAPGESPGWSEGGERGLVAALVCVYWVLLGYQAWSVGLTFDEPTHMLSSYLYWLNRPDLYPQDFPPLVKILTGWIPLALGIPLDPDLPGWKTGWTQDVASEVLDRLPPERIQELFYLMRLVMTVFPIATALLVWRWARLLFGRTVALLALLAAVLSPTPLAHGCLLKNDVAAAFTYLLAAFCGWRFWLEPSRRRTVEMAGAVLLAGLAKLSLLVVGVFAAVLVVLRTIRSPRRLVFALGALVVIPYVAFLAAYRFEVSLFGYVPAPVDLVRAVRSLSSYQESGAPVYMLGEAGSSPHLGYYPLALAIKTPIATQILFAGGLLLVVLRVWRREARVEDWFLLISGLLYVGLAMQSALQLGVRLVLPALPFFLLVGCFAIRRALGSRAGRVALLVLFGWLAAASASIYPQGIAYFNEWVGGPANGWKYLSGSNLDWGQSLPQLAEYVKRNRLKQVKLYYFGFDKLHRYGLQDVVIPQAAPWFPEYVGETILKPGPGVYAVSTTLLPGHFFDLKYRDYFRFFRERRPDAVVGYSIFVYNVQ